jgi:hypothetical protein
MTKANPRIGDTAWEVEWCIKLAYHDGSTEVDLYRCGYAVTEVETKEQAEKLAVKLYPEAAKTLGEVAYREIRYTSSGWEQTGEMGNYAGEET